jgi:hypothetical protein
MLCDALKLANGVYKFEEIIRDPKEYLYLTDNIVQEI